MHLTRARILPFLLLFAGCATTLQTVPRDWLSVPASPRIRSVTLGADGKVATSPEPVPRTAPRGSVRLTAGPAGVRILSAEKPVAEPFRAVDSFDLSEARGEIAFSARREGDFDIGLVAVEGSEISWAPNDPADEVAVKWAPKGSKISYIVRSRFADVVRTLHVPTSFSFAVDFPFSTIHDLGWDPAGERYAVAYSSPVASDAVDILKYSGEARTVAVKPAQTLAANIEILAGDAIVLQPDGIEYNEKLPLVVWIANDRLAWNDARAELMRTARVALVITSTAPGEALFQRARELVWVDPARTFVVGGPAAAIDGATVISGDAAVPRGRYGEAGGVVTVAPADIESFAARFIAERLKRTTPANGDSSR